MSCPVAVIEASNLTKTYGDFTAVDGISFEVAPGESFGLLGPNGAGKSTTMRMIGGTSLRTSGSLRVLGLDPEENGPLVRASLGVVPQQDSSMRNYGHVTTSSCTAATSACPRPT